MTSSYQRSILENGIRVVTDVMPGSRAISLGVLVEAGPRSETESQGSLAHRCEHRLFQGTTKQLPARVTLDVSEGFRVGAITLPEPLVGASSRTPVVRRGEKAMSFTRGEARFWSQDQQ